MSALRKERGDARAAGNRRRHPWFGCFFAVSAASAVVSGAAHYPSLAVRHFPSIYTVWPWPVYLAEAVFFFLLARHDFARVSRSEAEGAQHD